MEMEVFNEVPCAGILSTSQHQQDRLIIQSHPFNKEQSLALLYNQNNQLHEFQLYNPTK